MRFILVILDTAVADILPFSKIKEQLCQILLANHYIKSYLVEGEVKKTLKIEMSYLPTGEGVLSGATRISKPSVRRYAGKTDLTKAISGSGIAIISTSKGLMTHKQARSAGLGGEVICKIW